MKMKVKIMVAVFMIGLITQGHAQLYCYVCENCPEGNDLPDELFVSCSGEVTTAPTTPSTSTEPTVTTPIETTEATTNSTTESSTVSTSTVITTEPTEPSTSPPTSPPTTLSTEPTTQNTDPPSTETTPNTPEFPLTTTSVVPGTESTYTTNEMATGTVPTVPPPITSQTPGTPFVFSRNVYRQRVPLFLRQNLLKETAYNCFVIKKEVNGTEQIDRGCVVASPNYNDMCLNANANAIPLECRICATDKCNGASGIILSVVLMLCSICTVLSL